VLFHRSLEWYGHGMIPIRSFMISLLQSFTSHIGRMTRMISLLRLRSWQIIILVEHHNENMPSFLSVGTTRYSGLHMRWKTIVFPAP
jgi:hypothetical protein